MGKEFKWKYENGVWFNWLLSPKTCFIQIVTANTETSWIVQTREQLLRAVLLDGYVTERTIRKTVDGVDYDVTTYQGEHADEYLRVKVDSGDCQLCEKGIIKYSWKEVDGIKTGVIITYKDGMMWNRTTWDSLMDNKGYRYFHNDDDGLKLVVESDHVVYVGGFDDVNSMKREGRGMEFDKESGRVLRCGVWKNDQLFQITQEFESEEVMIEYKVGEEENMSALNRHPVYKGGFVYDEEKREYVRNGEGCEIEDGRAVRRGVWEKDVMVKSIELLDGCNTEMDESDSTLWGKYAVVHNTRQWENMDKEVVSLVIASKCCNDGKSRVLDLSRFSKLKSLKIGDECFANVDEVKMVGLAQLETVVIGKNCFANTSCVKNPNRHFYLKNCPVVKELKIGTDSFSDYTLCEIEDAKALETIEIGDLREISVNFFWADLVLRSGRRR